MTRPTTTGKAQDLITFTRSTTGTYLGSDGLLKSAAIDEARIEYDASGNCLGLLVEEARTNGLLRSELIGSTSWANNAVLISQNATTAPDGSNTATSLISTDAFGEHWTQQAGTNTAATETFSVYAKPNGFNYLYLRTNLGGSWSTGYASFNVATGEVGVVGSAIDSTTITYAGNGWYRCSMTFDDRNGLVAQFHAKPADTASSASTGDGVNGLYIWGAQVETGSFPTSYIPTSGSTVTRAADVASLAVSEFGYNQDQGSVVVQTTYTSPDAPTGVSAAFGLDDGTANNRMWYYANKGQWIGSNSGSTTFSVNSLLYPTIGVPHKASVAYKVNDFPLAIDGAFIGTDTSSPVPVVNLLAVGKTSSGTYLNGHIKSIQYYPLRLSNAQLQALTL